MSRGFVFVLILLVSLVPVWVLYRYLKQGLHEATFRNKVMKFTGPAALYVFLVTISFMNLLPPLPQVKPLYSVTAQLWPRSDIRGHDERGRSGAHRALSERLSAAQQLAVDLADLL